MSVSLYVVTITRHSVAMWGGYLLLCLYHCILQLLPDTVLPCGEVASCCVCIIVCCNYYQTQCCHVGRLFVVVSVSLLLLPDTVLPCGEVASCCVCIIVCCNYYQTQCCHVGRLSCCVCIIVCCNYYQTQCCHVGRLFVVVSVSLYIAAITRHSVAMWGGCLLLCLYHCML